MAVFLPQGGAPAVLDKAYVDPTSTAAGELAGQVVSLALNVGFDLADPDFGASATPLEALVMQGTDCAGMTVAEVLALANDVLGGCSSAKTPTAVNGCVDVINQAVRDGTKTSPMLRLP